MSAMMKRFLPMGVALVASLLMLPMSVASGTESNEAPPVGLVRQQGTNVNITVTAPGSTDDSRPEPRGASTALGANECYAPNGTRIDCVGFGGRWHYAMSCYARPSPYQPPFTDAVWQGNTDGVIMECTRGDFGGWTLGWEWWQASATAEPPPDPRVLAERAVESMRLAPVEMGIFPRSLDEDPDALGYVGWNVWLWAQNSAANTWGPISRTASAAGYSVTATANVARVEWDMGNGDVVTCGAGKPWRAVWVNNEASPDCGYVYDYPQQYTVTATSHWVVEWEGIGQSGTIDMTLSDTREVNVAEIQVVITGMG